MADPVEPIEVTVLSDEARRLKLQRAFNVRHVGGYQTTGGRVTRPGAFYRADSRHAITGADREILLGTGIRTILDLCDAGDQRAFPNLLAGAPTLTYRQVSIYDDWKEFTAGENGLVSIARHNQLMLAGCGDRLREAFGYLADGDMPMLVHCAVGKDRTGLVFGMLLDLAGVPARTIAADYALSYDYLAPVLDTWRARGLEDGFDSEEYEQILKSPPSAIASTLEHLETAYGGTRVYLRQIGVSAVQIMRLQERMIA